MVYCFDQNAKKIDVQNQHFIPTCYIFARGTNSERSD